MMKEVNGTQYYKKDEFVEVLMTKLRERANDLKIPSLARSLEVIPVMIQTGPLPNRIYTLDQIPVVSTGVNKHGFYFINTELS